MQAAFDISPAPREPMMKGRSLTRGEWAQLSPGLVSALRASGANPRIVPKVHPAAAVSAIWRGATPILTRGDAVWWPAAGADFSNSHTQLMTLQHELQHVLDYRSGFLSAAKYLLHPRHWTYDRRWPAGACWDSLGAEQRAVAAEMIWRLEQDPHGGPELDRLRRLVPWAAQDDARV